MGDEHLYANDLIDQYDLARAEWLAATQYWKDLPKIIDVPTAELMLKMLQDAQQLCRDKKARMTWLRNEILLRLDTEPLVQK